jgi:tRNA dimethylallyltransferase
MPEKVVCVVGPTACGKTTLGVMLAQKFGGEVVSADSMQIYRGMEIGTAAPTAEETRGVPHYMVGVADPRENYSAARFVAEASECVDDILARGKLPVIVGGTGLWLDALVAGTDFAGGHSGGKWRAILEKRLETEGAAALHAELSGIDPKAAAKIQPTDAKRITRALEMYCETGKTKTEHDEETRKRPPRYDAVYIGLAFRDREDMKRLIDRRVDAMMAAGLPDEVRALVASGVPLDSTALQAIGYKELLPALAGNISAEDAAEEIKLRSRQYAKRQLTWLRRNKNIRWIFWEHERDFDMALHVSTNILTAEGLG